ncbi:hypothetical protein ONZ45_g6839 [Pleurotus djamor]|nr:hypothetical protein ONZ45_g6839 [Pleurotus djamor]
MTQMNIVDVRRVSTDTQCEIAKLPPELLSQIFLENKVLSTTLLAYTLRYRSDRKERSWLNVAGVCRSWREIALDTPRLWSSFDISRLDSVEAMLARSKNAPLHISCKSGPFEARLHTSIAREIMLRITMIQELNLSSSSSNLREFFTPLQHSADPEPLPLLHTLRLTARHDCSGPFTLPDRLVAQQLPSLRILELHNVPILSTLPPLPRLLRLRLSSQNTDHAISIPSLLYILRNTPDLEDLYLSHVLTSSSVESTLPKVTAGKLKSVYIKSPDIQCSRLFKYLDLPLSAIVRFETSQASSTPSPDVSGLVALFSRYTKECAPAIDCVRISSSGAPPQYLSVTLYTPSSETLCNVHIISEEPMLRLTDLALELCEALPCSGITALRLDGLDGFQLSTCSELFRNFNATQRLEASYVSAPPLRAMTQSNLLPKLNQIQLRCCNFGAAFSTNAGARDMLPAVMDLIKDREDRDLTPLVVTIQQCQITARDVEEIARNTDVDWDGDELLD